MFAKTWEGFSSSLLALLKSHFYISGENVLKKEVF